jgi:hypothetical protein
MQIPKVLTAAVCCASGKAHESECDHDISGQARDEEPRQILTPAVLGVLVSLSAVLALAAYIRQGQTRRA